MEDTSRPVSSSVVYEGVMGGGGGCFVLNSLKTTLFCVVEKICACSANN